MKNKYFRIGALFLLTISFISSCSKYNVDEDLGIDIAGLSPKNIQTNLAIIDLTVIQAEFAQ